MTTKDELSALLADPAYREMIANLARVLSKFEPQVDTDLFEARRIVDDAHQRVHGTLPTPPFARGGRDGWYPMQAALDAIKHGRELERGK